MYAVLSGLFFTIAAISATVIVYAQYMDVEIIRRALYSVVLVMFGGGLLIEEVVSAVSPDMKLWIRVGYVGCLVFFAIIRIYQIGVWYDLTKQIQSPPPIYFARWRGRQARAHMDAQRSTPDAPNGLLTLLESEERADIYRLGDALRFVYPEGINSANLDEARVVADAMYSGHVVAIAAHRKRRKDFHRR